MSTQTRSGSYSFGDFLELIPEDRKADLLDGVIHVASPESLEHNDIVSWLSAVLRTVIDERRLGTLVVNRVAFRLGPRTAPEPDVAFVSAARADIRRPGYFDGPPDLAIEVVSPESVSRDYDEKRGRYEAAGVREYWIIDADERRATFLVLEGGKFVDAALDAGVFRSRVLPGAFLDPSWLWERPLPSVRSTVDRLLSGRPG